MVQVFAITVMRQRGEELLPIMLSSEFELGSFGFFKRGTVKELVTFFSRQVVQRTAPGEKNVISEGDYICYCYVSGESLATAVVTDKEYPQRIALSLAALVLQEFKSSHGNSWDGTEADIQLDTPAIREFITKYQEPDKADNIAKIQKDLDEVKDVLHKSMEDLLTRGEKLENIIERSEDLSSSSKQFLWQAKKTNSCCPSYYS